MQKHNALTTLVAANDSQFNATYDIRISERQRHWLQTAMKLLISSTDYVEFDEYGNDIVSSLENMLDPQGTTGPLITTGINSFVV
jgi:hypothetical protein